MTERPVTYEDLFMISSYNLNVVKRAEKKNVRAAVACVGDKTPEKFQRNDAGWSDYALRYARLDHRGVRATAEITECIVTRAYR